MSPTKIPDGKVRYAVVGLGYIAQVAVLPAFKHASKNSRLAALVSDDPEKLRTLSEEYGVKRTATYDKYDELLTSGEIDAVYIALPNHLHAGFTIRAASAGIHVLCEKPMAVTAEECIRMIEAAEENGIKLMIAYRLHFEKANLKAVEIVQTGKIGVPRFFDSTINGKTRKRTFQKRDQFAPEIEYFSNCILKNKKPEPSGEEGLIDVRIIESIIESTRTGRPVTLGSLRKTRRPEPEQEIQKPEFEKPELVNAEAPSRK